MTGSHPSPVERYAGNLTQQEQAAREGERGSADATLSQFDGPVESTPFYKSLLLSGTESTGRAYKSAKANMASQAHAAGFGYEQPIAQGAQDQLDAAEATDMAALPRQAAVATAPLSLQSASLHSTLSAAENPNTTLGIASTMEAQRLQRQQAQAAAAAQAAAQAAATFAG